MIAEPRSLPEAIPGDLGIGPELWGTTPPDCVLRHGFLNVSHPDIVVLHHLVTDFYAYCDGPVPLSESLFHSLCEVIDMLLDQRDSPDAYAGSNLHQQVTVERMD